MGFKCWWSSHKWVYWHTDKGTPQERVFRACKSCGKKQEEVWTGFSDYYWCPVGYMKAEILDKLSGE